MQVSNLAGSSAWAMRSLFPPPSPERQEASSTGQTMPSAGSTPQTRINSIQMSAGLLSSLIGLQSSGTQQMGGSQGPNLNDVATSMIKGLDQDGDGVVSASEAQSSGSSNATDAFKTLDANADGSLTTDEVASALTQMGPPPGMAPGGAGRAGKMSSSDIASQILSSLGGKDGSGLSLTQVQDVFGREASSSDVSKGLSILDGNGDGALSLAELTAAIEQYTQGSTSTSGASRAVSGSAVVTA